MIGGIGAPYAGSLKFHEQAGVRESTTRESTIRRSQLENARPASLPGNDAFFAGGPLGQERLVHKLQGQEQRVLKKPQPRKEDEGRAAKSELFNEAWSGKPVAARALEALRQQPQPVLNLQPPKDEGSSAKYVGEGGAPARDADPQHQLFQKMYANDRFAGKQLLDLVVRKAGGLTSNETVQAEVVANSLHKIVTSKEAVLANPPENAEAYLSTLVRNTYNDLYRARTRGPIQYEGQLPAPEADDDHPSSNSYEGILAKVGDKSAFGADPADKVEQTQLLEKANRELNQVLSKRQLHVMEEYLKGSTVIETADSLGLSPLTVKDYRAQCELKIEKYRQSCK